MLGKHFLKQDTSIESTEEISKPVSKKIDLENLQPVNVLREKVSIR